MREVPNKGAVNQWRTKDLAFRFRFQIKGMALTVVGTYAKKSHLPWQMPTINELESLVDASIHSPALPAEHPFSDIQQAYRSSTTSSFETDWSYVLYIVKGAVGGGL